MALTRLPFDLRNEHGELIDHAFNAAGADATRPPGRVVVIAHGVISFFFSVCILALAVNIGSNLV